MPKRKQRTRAIPEVFSDTPTTDMEHENFALSKLETALVPDQERIMQNPKLPEIYNELQTEVKEQILSKRGYYAKLARFTPYLIKNLLYISQSHQASKRDQIQASKILLDKIMPSLEAQHIKLDSDGVQGLVIVKSGTSVPGTSKSDIK